MPYTRSMTVLRKRHAREAGVSDTNVADLAASSKRQAREKQTASPLDTVRVSPIQGMRVVVGRSEAGGSTADKMLRTFIGGYSLSLLNLCDDYARHRRVVLMDDATCIATAVVKVTSLLQGRQRVLEIPFLTIDKPARGKGFGRLLVKALVKLGQSMGCTLMVAFAIKASFGFWTKAQMQAYPEPGPLKRALAEFRACSETGLGFQNTVLVARAL